MELKKVDKIDILLIVLSILCFGYSTHWLYNDYNAFQVSSSAHPIIGKISTFSNKVKRKFSDSLVWYAAKEAGDIHEGDWIFTGSDSKVTITFSDGGTLEIEPDSLVVLRRDKGGLDIQLTHGSLLANLNEASKISIDNGEANSLTDAKGTFQLSKKNNQSQIQVLAGAASFDGQKLQKDEQLVYDDGELSREQMGIRLKLPLDNSALRIGANRMINFQWETTDTGPFQVEFSSSLNFKEALKKEVKNQKVQIPSPLLGQVYWRVKSLGPKGSDIPPSSIRKFFAKLSQAPKILNPANLSESGTFDEFPAIVNFSWSDPMGSWTHYDVQVSATPNFEVPVDERTDLITQVTRIELPEPGIYFWRVRGIDQEKKGFSRWSPTAKFNYTQKILGPVEQLSLFKKDIVYPLKTRDLGRLDKDGKLSLTSNNPPLEIRWNANKEANGYILKIADDAEMTKIHQELQIEESAVTLSSIHSGMSYYSVVPTFERERPAPMSQGTIKAYFPGPKNLKVSTVNKTKELRWTEIKSKLGYEVQYRQMSKKSFSWKSLFVEHGSVISPFQDDAFEWKVRMVDLEERKTRSHFSKTIVHTPVVETKAPASVEPPPPVKGPHPIFSHPEKRKTFLVSAGAATFVLFRWNYSLKADAYELEIGRNESMSQILMTKVIPKRSKFVLKKELGPGIYYYRARADVGGLKSDWSDIQQFRVVDH